MRADKHYGHCTKAVPVSKPQNTKTHLNILCITYTHYRDTIFSH